MNSFRTSLLSRAVRAGALGLIVTCALPAFAQQTADTSSSQQVYSIQQGPLNEALNQFAQQNGVLLSYDPALTSGKTSKGLQGSYTQESGFSQLLAGSGLQAHFSADGSVSLATAPAGASASQAVVRDDRIVVTAPPNTALKLDAPISETPRAVSTVSDTTIQERGVQKLDQALQYSPGVLATPYGPDNKTDWLFIRGFPWSRFQDGLSTLKENGFYEWQQESFGIERVDVLKGPASVLYGQNPPGGLVNVISKRPTRLPQGQIDLKYGSNDYRHLAIDSAGPVNDDGTILYRVVGMANDTNGSTDYSESQRYYLAPSMTFLMGEDTELTVLASYMDTNANPTSGFKLPYGTLQNTPFGKVGYTTTLGEPGYSRSDSQQFSLGYEFSHNFNDTWTFHQNFSYSYLNLDLRSPYVLAMVDDRHASRGLTYRDGFAQGWVVDNRMVGNWLMANSENTLLLGIDYQNANTRSHDGNLYSFGQPIDIFNPVYGNFTEPTDADLFYHKSNRNQTGYYIQDQFKYDDHWIFLLGGRYDSARSRDQNLTSGADTRMDDTKFTKTAGMMYLFDNGISPYISYAESFLPVPGRDAYDNPYKPQTGKQTEVGLKYTPEGYNGYVTAAVYELTQQNVLTTDPDRPGVQVQTGEARSRGLELEGKGEIVKGLTLTANYTYSKVETTKSGVEDEVGKRLPKMPLHSASGWLSYAFNGQLEGLMLGTGVRYVGSSYGDAVNSADMKVPAYTLLDAMARYDFNKNWRLQVNASNLTDREYVSACDYWCYYGEGRNLSANITYLW
ncbi:TonB-dependent siderophore receptor [Edaphovirga cremea]|uniref:TonB-dependent siderophore receptor n=1 Tax=Edaphovirga cremea TaxID=2267246 RepID=UPI003989880F